MSTPSDWDRLGGEAEVRGHVQAFVHRVFDDMIIGYLFQGRDPARIAQHELEHASRHLGGPLVYAGRPIGAVHKPLRIHQGHFRRRMALLRTVLLERGVPEDVVRRWIAADEALMGAVVVDGDCLGPIGG